MATTALQYIPRSTSEQTQWLNKSVLFSAPIWTERAPCTRSLLKRPKEGQFIHPAVHDGKIAITRSQLALKRISELYAPEDGIRGIPAT
jgi:hypothetical protein